MKRINIKSILQAFWLFVFGMVTFILLSNAQVNQSKESRKVPKNQCISCPQAKGCFSKNPEINCILTEEK